MPRKTRVALLAPSRFNPSELEPELRDPFVKKDEEVNEAMSRAGKSLMVVGKKLFEMQQILKAERRFVSWLETKMPAKTGYRAIGAWKRLQELSPLVAERALAQDIPMFGVTSRSPFGKYTETIKLLPPPPKDDPIKVDLWLAQLRETRKANPPKKRVMAWLDQVADMIARAYLKDPKAD